MATYEYITDSPDLINVQVSLSETASGVHLNLKRTDSSSEVTIATLKDNGRLFLHRNLPTNLGLELKAGNIVVTDEESS